MWTISNGYGGVPSSYEMIIRDQEGDNIHCSIRSCFFKKHTHVLLEGKTCVISTFNVGPNNGSYRTTTHPYRIYFLYSTTVRPFKDDGVIHQFGFDFRSFTTVLSPEFDDRYLFDVIGKLSSFGDIEQCLVKGEKQQRLEITLTDEEYERLECTLWGTFATNMEKFVSQHDNGPIIVIVQSCKAKEFQGRKKLSNSMFSSRLLINEPFLETNQFLYKLRSVGIDVNAQIEHILPHGTIAIADELLSIGDRRQIIHLREGPKDVQVGLVATIIDLRLDRGWSYMACTRCAKKVIPDGQAYFCVNCEAIVKFVVPRFMVTCEVKDETGTCNLVIFDREFSRIVGNSAAEIKEQIAHKQLQDILPDEIVQKVIGKQYLFKFKIPQDFIEGKTYSCKVMLMSGDEEIIGSYIADLGCDDDNSGLNPGGVIEEQDLEQSFMNSEACSSSIVATSEKSNDEYACDGGDDEKSFADEDKHICKKIKIEDDH